MKTMIAGLVISMAVALIPPPRITVDNPKLLFAAAMYKTATGDTQSALRLMQRAGQARQSTGTVPRNTSQTASGRSALATIL